MIQAIIFDLDGTLLDTLKDLTDSVNHVMRLHNMPVHTLDEIRSFIGNGVPTLIARSVPRSTDEKTKAQCVDEMHTYYKEHSRDSTKPYEGIEEMLSALCDMGIKTAVVTNKIESAAIKLCDDFFGKNLNAVIGDNAKDRLKPEPDNLLRAMSILKINKENVLYVGDSDVDIITGKRAGVKTAGVTWGFRDEAVLRKNGADFIVNKPSELLKTVKCMAKS